MRGVSSSTLLIQVVISSRSSFLAPSKQRFSVSRARGQHPWYTACCLSLWHHLHIRYQAYVTSNTSKRTHADHRASARSFQMRCTTTNVSPVALLRNSSTSASWSSQLTEFLVRTICLNGVRALQCLTGDALHDGLHGPNVVQFCSCEKRVDSIHLQKECAICLVNNYLQPVD